jgi:cell division protein FtsW
MLTGATGMLVIFLGRASVKHLLLTVMAVLVPIALLVGIALKTYKPEDIDAQ